MTSAPILSSAPGFVTNGLTLARTTYPDTLRTKAGQRLHELERSNVLANLDEAPTGYQVANYCRGFSFVESNQRFPAAYDFDGTLINTCADRAAIWGGAIHIFANNFLQGILGDKAFQLTNEAHFPTEWRIGIIDYLLGQADAANSGVPVITYGWSFRPAMMAYANPAMRALFLGPSYVLDKPQEAAKAKAGEKWAQYSEYEQRQKIIEELEIDLLNAPNFMSTVHLRQVIESILTKLEGGPKAWSTFSSDELEVLDHAYARRTKDYFNPQGFAVTVGGKMPAVARLAGKPVVEQALKAGLADDGEKHIDPHVARGLHGILVNEGKEYFIDILDNDAAKTLSTASIGDVVQTKYLIDALEADSVGKITITPGHEAIQLHPGVTLNARQKSLLLRVGQVPLGYPLHADFFDQHGFVGASINQYFGERRRTEWSMINYARFGQHEVKKLPINTIAALSALEMGLAGTLSDVAQYGLQTYEAGIAAVFLGLGFAQEKFGGRQTAGSLYRMSVSTFAMMYSGLVLAQAISPNATIHAVQDLKLAAAFTCLQILLQRSVIPALVIKNAKKAIQEIIDHQTDKNFKPAQRTFARGRVAAEVVSFAATGAMMYELMK